jgi:hypothetical protein
MTGLIAAVALLAYLAIPPIALPQPCPVVRQAVELLGEDGAMALAAQRGWTPAQIDEAKRRCLAK